MALVPVGATNRDQCPCYITRTCENFTSPSPPSPVAPAARLPKSPARSSSPSTPPPTPSPPRARAVLVAGIPEPAVLVVPVAACLPEPTPPRPCRRLPSRDRRPRHRVPPRARRPRRRTPAIAAPLEVSPPFPMVPIERRSCARVPLALCRPCSMVAAGPDALKSRRRGEGEERRRSGAAARRRPIF